MYFNYFVNEKKLNFDVLIWNKPNVMPLYKNQYLNDVEYCLYFRGPGVCDPRNYEDAKLCFLVLLIKEIKMHFTIQQ